MLNSHLWDYGGVWMRTQQLPRKSVYVDKKGRIVIPKYMRESIGVETDSWVDIEKYPIEGDTKALFIKKA